MVRIFYKRELFPVSIIENNYYIDFHNRNQNHQHQQDNLVQQKQMNEVEDEGASYYSNNQNNGGNNWGNNGGNGFHPNQHGGQQGNQHFEGQQQSQQQQQRAYGIKAR